MKATAVIGGSLGDEGKGQLVSYFAAQDPDNTVVVRFNGGAQAGHTVVTEGVRHVFSHHGSGTLAGASTYLSRYFIVNPYLWGKEAAELRDKVTSQPDLAIHPLAMLTTPYDMLVNQVVEESRGKSRHGSCGVGINETADRCNGPLGTFAQHMWNLGILESVLWKIYKHVARRLKILGVEPTKAILDRLESIDMKKYLVTCESMTAACRLEETTIALNRPRIVFEGAQGLLLDEKHRFFPHVTRSRTGLTNVAAIAEQIALRKIDVVYVTRSYMTRHGAGPFPTEDKRMRFEDRTNAPNDWQGSLRFGELDTDLIAEAVNVDLMACRELDVTPCLAVTCMDQRPEKDPFQIAAACGLPLGYTSCGPSRDCVQRLDTRLIVPEGR